VNTSHRHHFCTYIYYFCRCIIINFVVSLPILLSHYRLLLYRYHLSFSCSARQQKFETFSKFQISVSNFCCLALHEKVWDWLQGSGFRVWGSGFRVQGLGTKVRRRFSVTSMLPSGQALLPIVTCVCVSLINVFSSPVYVCLLLMCSLVSLINVFSLALDKRCCRSSPVYVCLLLMCSLVSLINVFSLALWTSAAADRHLIKKNAKKIWTRAAANRRLLPVWDWGWVFRVQSVGFGGQVWGQVCMI